MEINPDFALYLWLRKRVGRWFWCTGCPRNCLRRFGGRICLDFGARSYITSCATAYVMLAQHPQHCQTLVPPLWHWHSHCKHPPSIKPPPPPQHWKVKYVIIKCPVIWETISPTAPFVFRHCPSVHRPSRKAVEGSESKAGGVFFIA